MNKLIIFIGLILTLVLVFYNVYPLWAQPPSSDMQKVIPANLKQKILQFRDLVDAKKAEGVDIFKAMELDRQSREAVRAGNFGEGIKLLDMAISTLKGDSPVKTHTDSGAYPSQLIQVQGEERYKTVEIGVNSAEVTVKKAVPNFQYGKDVSSSENPFSGSAIKAAGGKIKINISSIPVFVEERAPGGDSSLASTAMVSLNSPFGGLPVPTAQFDQEYKKIGVKWVRYAGRSMAWDIVERRKGVYDWSLCDGLVRETEKNGIHSMMTVRSFNQWDQPAKKLERGKFLKPNTPTDLSAFLKFLAKAVERYNGDGVDDASGSPVVTYWQIENEVDGNFWGDSPESYAKLLKAAYQTIKKANPKAKVVIAGASTVAGFKRFYIPVLQELRNIADHPGDRYFDVFDIHWYGFAGEYRKMEGQDLQSFIDYYNKVLSNYGYSNTPLWMTETGTYGGRGVVGKRGESLPEQNEAVQAAELVKRYVYFIGNGIKKVFWYQMTEEHHDGFGTKNDNFENLGLIRNPRNKGDSYKKLAYYSYKHLVDMLEGCDWEKTRSMDLGKDIYAYRFLKNGQVIYVLWYDPSN